MEKNQICLTTFCADIPHPQMSNFAKTEELACHSSNFHP
jgi:hypothetical protein